MMNIRTVRIAAATWIAVIASFAVAEPAPNVTAQDAQEIAGEAYTFAYPLVLMDVTRQQLTNHAEPNETGQGPPNRFVNLKEFPDPQSKIVIRPNADTLYSSAWLDLKAEPIVLSVPAVDRYFMLPMLSMWTDVFAVPGTRTTGPYTARTFLVTGPGWGGSVPAGMEQIRSPTRYVWFIGRTQTNGKADYDAVHEIQEGYKLTPSSAWGKADWVAPKGVVDPNVDMKTPPPVQVDKMDVATFFARFAELLKDNPAKAIDYPIVHRMERIGLVPGRSFALSSVTPEIQAAFERGAADAKKAIADGAGKSSGGKGWSYRTTGGSYGVEYAFRAEIAAFGLGYNLPQDAIYPSVATDGEGRPFDGNHRYVLHFEKGKLPPVRAFWSVTAYDAEGYFIPNAIERQAIGDRDKLVPNPDGSVDLYIQAEAPGGTKDANWLPVAKAPFNLLMRLYWPSREILDGSWTPPAVSRVP